MEKQCIKCGETMYGPGPYTIDDVTTGAVIILRSSETSDVAVMHLDAMDAPRSYPIVDDFVAEFRSRASLSETPNNIEVLLVGGEFREHRPTEREVLVYVDHVIAKEKAQDALRICGLRFTYCPTDRKSTKTVVIKSAKEIEISEERRGLNKFDAIKSEADYDMTIGRYDGLD